jgi:hypothetical protein
MIRSHAAPAGSCRLLALLAVSLLSATLSTGCHNAPRSAALVVVRPAALDPADPPRRDRVRLQTAPNPAGAPWAVEFVNATEIIMLDTLGVLQQVSLATERPWWRRLDSEVCAVAVHRPSGTYATARYADDQLKIRSSASGGVPLDLSLPLTAEEQLRQPMLVASFNANADKLLLSESLRTDEADSIDDDDSRRMQAWLIDLRTREIARLDVVDAHFIADDAYLCGNAVEQGVWLVQTAGDRPPARLPQAVTRCIYADATTGRAILSHSPMANAADTPAELCAGRWQGGQIHLDRPFDPVPPTAAACLIH